ncbi:hypothetical protein TPY_2687 [Sulfobacillus acidophilus TPY]|uniref:Uncharacterized protein n=1 Tax=Sulfobacillus acidophilus (strain ATCC 700253 / DSM 10332 / NAL) TaxID=679936 RepID=G8TUP6_SULAD|nr:hypothetical protein TPY_2687 [Sulfobacillus acidophilus TPY]AEW04693.1 hypothetical protein Sulac_1193 [Sulfobacillus acidophilus DSM 10332]
MIWDRRALQPWAWLWSDLERGRLGPMRLTIRQWWSWIGPWMSIGYGLGHLGGSMDGAAGAWGGMMLGVISLLLIPRGIHVWRIHWAVRHGWETVFWEPTSWAVWMQTARQLGVDPRPDLPHWERHTIQRPWHDHGAIPPATAAQRYLTRRRAEWQALVRAESPTPNGVMLSHTYSTIGGITPQRGRVGWGTFPQVARHADHRLTTVQRQMFGAPLPLRGQRSLADPVVWHVVWLPIHVPALQAPGNVGISFHQPIKEESSHDASIRS